jgi:tetratricopeptide (TPR) repeat protein
VHFNPMQLHTLAPQGLRWLSVCACALIVACSNPEADKARHLERGNQYAAEKRYEFAAVEYRSAIQIDPKFGEARLKLAETLEKMNNLPAAFTEYVRAADALPNNRDAQVKAAQVMLLSRRFEDAKARTTTVLEKNPNDIEAILLRANAMAALQDAQGALDQIEEALRISPGDSGALINLGAVRMQRGQATEAEAAFRQAITLAPESVDGLLALANFMLSSNRIEEAEALLKEALAKQPQHLLTNRMLGVLFLATDRTAEAEGPLKTIAEVSKSPAARLQLADYYVEAGRTNEALRLLTAATADEAISAEAEARLAALDYAKGDAKNAHQRIDAALAKQPNNSGLLLIKAQWLVEENKLDDALVHARAAVAAAPQSAQAHYGLAVILDRRNQTAEAAKAYTEVLRLNPRAAIAQVALSRINLTTGDTAAAIRQAEEARQLAPNSGQATAALVRSLLASGNIVRAEAEIAGLMKTSANNAVPHTLLGTLEATKGNYVAARAAYQRALEFSPGFLEALGGLTYVDLQERSPQRAVVRLDGEISRRPDNAALLGLLARAHNAAGDYEKAEQALKRSVTIDPRFTAGYSMLAQLYMQRRRLDEARAEFERMAQRDPSALGAKTMVGVLLEVQGKRTEARAWYERMVGNPDDAPVAANNLAFIYAEQGINLDIALQLASAAKRGLPDDPNIDDTLGWVYYKKDLPSLAVGPLEASLKKRPDNAEALYHLGLVYTKLGNQAKAREALSRALKLDPKIGGEAARQALASVSG